MILDEVPCIINPRSINYFWGKSSGDWRGIKSNKINLMMALKPTEDGKVRGLLNIVCDKILSRELKTDLYFPEHLKELQLTRIYRCTQKISRFYQLMVRHLKKFSFTYYTSNSTGVPFHANLVMRFLVNFQNYLSYLNANVSLIANYL